MSRRRPYRYCGSRRTPYSHKNGFIERLLAFLRVPCRCQDCDGRFLVPTLSRIHIPAHSSSR
jgi:hypothetical protein